MQWRIYEGGGATSLDFTPPAPSTTFYPGALICNIHRSVRTLSALWAFQSRPLFWGSQAHKGPFPLRNTARPDAPRPTGGHPPAAMSPGAGERRLLPCPGRGPGVQEQRPSRSPATGFASPGTLHHFFPPSPAARCRERPGAARPRSARRCSRRGGGGACRGKC